MKKTESKLARGIRQSKSAQAEPDAAKMPDVPQPEAAPQLVLPSAEEARAQPPAAPERQTAGAYEHPQRVWPD